MKTIIRFKQQVNKYCYFILVSFEHFGSVRVLGLSAWSLNTLGAVKIDNSRGIFNIFVFHAGHFPLTFSSELCKYWIDTSR